jgi:hypothetical protein
VVAGARLSQQLVEQAKLNLEVRVGFSHPRTVTRRATIALDSARRQPTCWIWI